MSKSIILIKIVFFSQKNYFKLREQCSELQSLKEVKSRTFERLGDISKEIVQHQAELTPEVQMHFASGATLEGELSNFEEIHNFGSASIPSSKSRTSRRL